MSPANQTLLARFSVAISIFALVMVGGSFIKSVITGTVARETTAANRATTGSSSS